MHLAGSSLFSHSLVAQRGSMTNGASSDASCAGFLFLHYVGLPVILPQDNRGLCGAAQPGHPQWQSSANLLSETNLFDTAVQDMDIKSCLEKTHLAYS